jgi:hypothetical protein
MKKSNRKCHFDSTRRSTSIKPLENATKVWIYPHPQTFETKLLEQKVVYPDVHDKEQRKIRPSQTTSKRITDLLSVATVSPQLLLVK